jgi:5-keto 4-deoxyuronate isomerase
MKVRVAPDPVRYRTMSTSELRENFLVKLFKSDKINLVYSNVDRAIVLPLFCPYF